MLKPVAVVWTIYLLIIICIQYLLRLVNILLSTVQDIKHSTTTSFASETNTTGLFY